MSEPMEIGNLSQNFAGLTAEMLAEHIEKFACAYVKETGLPPEEIVMCQERTFAGMKIWFEAKDEQKKLELKIQSLTAEVAELKNRIANLRKALETADFCLTRTDAANCTARKSRTMRN